MVFFLQIQPSLNPDPMHRDYKPGTHSIFITNMPKTVFTPIVVNMTNIATTTRYPCAMCATVRR